MIATMDEYSGNSFSIDRSGDDWTLWRISNDDGDREQLILTTDAMDELRAYFAKFYAADRAEAQS